MVELAEAVVAEEVGVREHDDAAPPCSVTAASGAHGLDAVGDVRASTFAPLLRLSVGRPVEARLVDAREEVHPVVGCCRSARTQCGAFRWCA